MSNKTPLSVADTFLKIVFENPEHIYCETTPIYSGHGEENPQLIGTRFVLDAKTKSLNIRNEETSAAVMAIENFKYTLQNQLGFNGYMKHYNFTPQLLPVIHFENSEYRNTELPIVFTILHSTPDSIDVALGMIRLYTQKF